MLRPVGQAPGLCPAQAPTGPPPAPIQAQGEDSEAQRGRPFGGHEPSLLRAQVTGWGELGNPQGGCGHHRSHWTRPVAGGGEEPPGPPAAAPGPGAALPGGRVGTPGPAPPPCPHQGLPLWPQPVRWLDQAAAHAQTPRNCCLIDTFFPLGVGLCFHPGRSHMTQTGRLRPQGAGSPLITVTESPAFLQGHSHNSP